MILPVSPDSPAVVRAAAGMLLVLHIGGASIGLASGAAALAFRKGGAFHRAAGNVFFVSMLTMAGIGACVAPFLPQRGSAVAGVITFYLVATAWMTVRRKKGVVGRFEIGAFLVAVAAAATGVTLGLQAAASKTGTLDGIPALPHFVFATGVALAAVLDLSMILRGGVFGAQRLARHLWRMCVALFIACFSFFLGQSQVFPAGVRDSPILFAPEIAVVGLMIFWLVRVRSTNRAKAAASWSPAQPVRGDSPA